MHWGLRYLLVDNLGRASSVGAELRGAVATFLTMAYVLPVNAGILSQVVGGESLGSLVACTALAAGVCSLLMGLVANVPIALASGMGLNAIIAFSVAQQAGSWQAAMGLVVVEGLIILLLVLVGLREAVLEAIPRSLRLAIGAGVQSSFYTVGATMLRGGGERATGRRVGGVGWGRWLRIVRGQGRGGL